ncbi:MAG: tetratricopeptide repeat protein [Lentisphaerae bacterium]|jgi:TolA-binding protein|nr:tetratricopeptide repeat protein [Lentisphaerota bacterium]
MKRNYKIICFGLVVALGAGMACAAPYVIKPNGERVEGRNIRADKDGNINLTTSMGIETYPKGRYIKAAADQPAEYGQAEAALRAGKYDDAIKLLDPIISRYRFLTWDVEAAKLLPQAYLGKKDAEGAVKAYSRLFQIAPEEKKNSDVAWGMRQAMLVAKQYQALGRELDAVAASGSRTDAARAQIMRGDILLAQNDLNMAVLDYLRTAILFKDVSDPAVQGEAHFKAAQTLEALRDPRAKSMYKIIVDKYPSAPQAAQARSKL